jgi:hypothetical protein
MHTILTILATSCFFTLITIVLHHDDILGMMDDLEAPQEHFEE